MLQTVFSPFLNWIGRPAPCTKYTRLGREIRPALGVFRARIASERSLLFYPRKSEEKKNKKKKQVIYIKYAKGFSNDLRRLYFTRPSSTEPRYRSRPLMIDVFPGKPYIYRMCTGCSRNSKAGYALYHVRAQRLACGEGRGVFGIYRLIPRSVGFLLERDKFQNARPDS